MSVPARVPTARGVEEVLGLYGPVAISELLVQKVWLRRDLRAVGLRTVDGRALKVISPGRWNRLGGPDFLGAEIELAGRRILGDVEIHFYARDWRAHGHDRNAAFNGVVLHVVVFDPERGEGPATTEGGRELPVLVLSPLFREGLEEYAQRDALEALENGDPLELAAPLLKLGRVERRARLREAAGIRWTQKVAFARHRLASAGWEAACHQWALEILGYLRNRAPMSELAVRFPLGAWTGADTRFVEALFGHGKAPWRLQGCRPANHPKRRLEQYAAWTRAAPDWPTRLAARLDRWPAVGDPEESTRAFRRRLKVGGLRRELSRLVWAEMIPAPRADTLMIDGFLPLAAARLPDGEATLFPLWLHWPPGDLPEILRVFLRTAQVVSDPFPFSNGLQQGALQILFER